MWGAIVGDFVGSIYEHANLKGHTLPLISPTSHFTDDSVLTVATAQALLTDQNFIEAYQDWGHRYRDCGFSDNFENWLSMGGLYECQSPGNGAAMRVAPIGWLCNSEDEVKVMANRSAEPTHQHPDAIRAAQAVALAIFYARQGMLREAIRDELSQRFRYNLNEDLGRLHRDYEFTTVAKWSVPHAIQIALDSRSFKDAMRLGLYIGGDTDTICAIAGAIAEVLYPNQIPTELKSHARHYLERWAPDMIPVISKFELRKPILNNIK